MCSPSWPSCLQQVLLSALGSVPLLLQPAVALQSQGTLDLVAPFCACQELAFQPAYHLEHHCVLSLWIVIGLPCTFPHTSLDNSIGETTCCSLHQTCSCSIMYHTRVRIFSPRSFWINRPRLSSPVLGVALRIILAQTTHAHDNTQEQHTQLASCLLLMKLYVSCKLPCS